MKKRILIVGGGPGGTMTANHLARSLRDELRRGEVSLTLIAASDRHVYEAGYLFMALDLKRPGEFERSQRDLLLPGVDLVVDPAVGIDVAAGKVKGKTGKEYGYDWLVVATGSELRPDVTPGLAEGGDDFYTREGTSRLREKLVGFAGGRILCAVEMPHKCPVAYLELLFMLNDYYGMKALRERVELAFTYPAATVHMMPPVADFAKPLLDAAGIGYHLDFTVAEVDPSTKRVNAKDGRSVEYDLLFTVPTHRAPAVILDSGLGDAQGWIDTDPRTLRMKGTENVYVLGDATNLHLLKVSKAGSAAHYQAQVVAENLRSELHGESPNAFYDGKVFCFLETSLSEASCIQMSYGHPPKPAPPSKLLHWFKLSFNEMYWAAVRGVF